MLILWNKQWLRKEEKSAGLSMKQINSCWRFTLLKKLNCLLPNQYSSSHAISLSFFLNLFHVRAPYFHSTIFKITVWNSSSLCASVNFGTQSVPWPFICFGTENYFPVTAFAYFICLCSRGEYKETSWLLHPFYIKLTKWLNG